MNLTASPRAFPSLMLSFKTSIYLLWIVFSLAVLSSPNCIAQDTKKKIELTKKQKKRAGKLTPKNETKATTGKSGNPSYIRQNKGKSGGKQATKKVTPPAPGSNYRGGNDPYVSGPMTSGEGEYKGDIKTKGGAKRTQKGEGSGFKGNDNPVQSSSDYVKQQRGKSENSVGKKLSRPQEGANYKGDLNRQDYGLGGGDESAYKGGVKVKKGEKRTPQSEGSRYQGDENPVSNTPDYISQFRGRTKTRIEKKINEPAMGSEYRGNLKIDRVEGRGGQSDASRYKGDEVAQSNNPDYISQYRGKGKNKIEKKETKQHKGANYKGNEDFFAASPDYHGEDLYKGDLKVKSTMVEGNFNKKVASDVANFRGNVKSKKASKDFHPSAEYMEVKNKKSREKAENIRERKIWWSRRFNKDKDQPQYLKDKVKKPKYDSRESEIWEQERD